MGPGCGCINQILVKNGLEYKSGSSILHECTTRVFVFVTFLKEGNKYRLLTLVIILFVILREQVISVKILVYKLTFHLLNYLKKILILSFC